MSDERYLWPEMLRLIRMCRPNWVLGENVLGIRTTAADAVLSNLEEIQYTCWAFVVGAHIIGADHPRERVWFLAHPEREGLPGCKCGTGVFESAFATHAVSRNPISRIGGPVDAAIGAIPHIDGLPVGMVRNQIHALGNAVVPQVVEYIARAIKESA
jgi:DNA (cytosine-5)-methyltransferase 1